MNKPEKHNFSSHLAYAQAMEDYAITILQERDTLLNQIHTCGPNCTKAGCVNTRLRKAAQDVIDSWDLPITPLREDVLHRTKMIEVLRQELHNERP